MQLHLRALHTAVPASHCCLAGWEWTVCMFLSILLDGIGIQ